MSDGFISGHVELIQELKKEQEIKELLCLEEWYDGYLAFSKKELRLKQVKSLPLEELFKQQDGSTLEGVEGWLIEVDLWRYRDNCFEEISIEREDDRFFMQQWSLSTDVKADQENCFYRVVNPLSNQTNLFESNELVAFEVIVPQERLHFFITRGSEKS